MRLRRRREPRDETWQTLLYLKLLLLLAAIAYAAGFVVENHRHTEVHFVFHTTRISLIWVILLSNAIGVLGGVLISQLYRRRRRHEVGQAPDTLADLGDRDEAEREPEGAAPSA
jgi:uncharacterized integral membrane protein